MPIMELFWSSATMVSVPLALLMRCSPRSLPGVSWRPRSRVTLAGPRGGGMGGRLSGWGAARGPGDARGILAGAPGEASSRRVVPAEPQGAWSDPDVTRFFLFPWARFPYIVHAVVRKASG